MKVILTMLCWVTTLAIYSQDVIQVSGTYTESIDHTAPIGVDLIPEYSFDSNVEGGNMNAFLTPYQFSDIFQQEPIFENVNLNEFTTPSSSLNVGKITGYSDVTAYGSASYSLPLQLPSGIGEMTPNLALSYNSNGSEGTLGKGWIVSGVSEINRIVRINNQRFIQKRNISLDALDSYSIDGVEMIMDFNDYIYNPNTINESDIPYKTLNESFSKITYYGSEQQPWFLVESKSGVITEYGNTPDSRRTGIEDEWMPISWRINKRYDNYGNYIEYTYLDENNTNRIEKITYGGNSSTQQPVMIEVIFNYDFKLNFRSGYIHGRELDQPYLVSSIVVKVEGDDYGSYGFNYSSSQPHKLLSVNYFGSEGTGVNPTKMIYNNEEGQMNELDNIVFDNSMPLEENYVDYRTGDFNGDGKSDLIGYHYSPSFYGNPDYSYNSSNYLYFKEYTTYNLYLSDNDGKLHKSVDYDLPENFTIYSPEYINGYFRQVSNHTLDVNGDGFEDVIYSVVEDGFLNYYKLLSNGEELINCGIFNSFNETGTSGIQTVVGDFDGNGSSDMFFFLPTFNSGGLWYEVHFFDTNNCCLIESESGVQSSQTECVSNAVHMEFMYLKSPLGDDDISEEDPSVWIPAPPYSFSPLDMDGDGTTEIMTWVYDLAGVAVPMVFGFDPNCSVLDGNPYPSVIPKYYIPEGVEKDKLPMFGDLNGDGNDDVILRKENEIYSQIGTGVGFKSAEPILSDYPFSDYPSFRNNYSNRFILADINGDGLADMVNVYNEYENRIQEYLDQYQWDVPSLAAVYSEFMNSSIDGDPVLRDFIEDHLGYPFDCYYSEEEIEALLLVLFSEFEEFLISPEYYTGVLDYLVISDDEQCEIEGVDLFDFAVEFFAWTLESFSASNLVDGGIVNDIINEDYPTIFSINEEIIHGQMYRQMFNTIFYDLANFNHPIKVRTFINNGGALEFADEYSFSGRMFPNTYVNLGDFNGDGTLELVIKDDPRYVSDNRSVRFFDLGGNSGKGDLELIVDGLGNTTQFEYGRLSDDMVCEAMSNQYPFKNVKSPKRVVVKQIKTGPNGQNHIVSYKYKGAMSNGKGRGFMGFETRIIDDELANIRTEISTEFEREFYSLSQLQTTVKLLDSDETISYQQNNYSVSPVYASSYTGDNQCWLSTKYNYSSRLLNTRSFDYLNNKGELVTINEYDDFNNVLSSSRLIGSANVSINNFIVEENTTNTYDSYGNWGVDNKLLTSTVVVSRTPVASQVDGLDDYSRTTSFTYMDDGSILNSSDDKGVVTTYTDYDDYGHPLRIETIGPSVELSSTEYSYNATNRFVESETNVFDETATYEFNSVWDQPTKITDHLGRSESYYYDGFGKLLSTTDIMGMNTYNEYSWVNVSPELPGDDVLLTPDIMYKTRTYGDGIPESSTYYNRLGMVRKTEAENHFEETVISTIKYNDLGQVDAETELFKDGQATVLVNKYEYDDPIHRLSALSVQNQSGLQLIEPTMYGYEVEGNNSIITKITPEPGGNFTSKYVKSDPSGKPIEIADNFGNETLKFTYLSNGNQDKIKIGQAVKATMMYDNYGRQTTLIEPNAGTTIYDYDAYDRLTYQKDYKNNEYITAYDSKGRIESIEFIREEGGNNQSTEPMGFYDYEYNTTSPGKYLLKKITAPNGNFTQYTYDDYDRIIESIESVDGISFTSTLAYDEYGRIASNEFPGGLVTINHFNERGFLDKITNANENIILWQGLEQDHKGNYTRFKQGNDLVTEEIFDIFDYPSQKLSVYNDIQYLRTSFEPIKGNLMIRSDLLSNIKEEFDYDLGYNRLTGYQVVDLTTDIYLDPLEVCYNSGECSGADQVGNIMYKTDVGEYTYGNPDKPNAVTQVTDPNNLIAIDGDQNAIFNGFNSVESITQGDLLINFTYGVDQQRRKSELFVNNELARKRYYIGNFEKEIAGSQTTEVTNVYTPNGHTVMYVEENNGVGSFYFKYTDHLGSILKVTDVNGNIVASQNFDPYGRYRNPVSWTYLEDSPMTDGTLPTWLWRGYTGHEHLDEFGLINMNGRLYDPLLARMLSPDNYVQDPKNPQSYNRYSYVWNNPLKYVDPSGEYATGYTVDKEGNIEKVDNTGGDKYDVIWEKEEYDKANNQKKKLSYDYKGTGNTGIRIDDKSFIPALKIARKGYSLSEDVEIDYFYAQINSNQALDVFEFLAEASSSPLFSGRGNENEWSLLMTKDKNFFIGTIQEDSYGLAWGKLSEFSDLSKHVLDIHSHPGASYSSFLVSGEDYNYAKNTRKFNPQAQFRVYMPELTMSNYNRAFKNKWKSVNGQLTPYPSINYEPSKYHDF